MRQKLLLFQLVLSKWRNFFFLFKIYILRKNLVIFSFEKMVFIITSQDFLKKNIIAKYQRSLLIVI